MSPEVTFEYAVVRVVPRIERAEFVNVGVLVYSQPLGLLRAAVEVDEARLLSVDPGADVDAIAAAVDAFVSPCEVVPDVDASGGSVDGRRDRAGTEPDPYENPAARTQPGERFRWLTAPRSTIVQTGPVHAGLTDDPVRELRHLLDRLVR